MNKNSNIWVELANERSPASGFTREQVAQRRAALGEYRRQQAEVAERKRRCAALRPAERVLMDRGRVEGSLGDWQEGIVEPAHRALAADARRDRSNDAMSVRSIYPDPDSREEEIRRLGGTPTRL